MDIYCRRFELRNCGRFLHVSSDFGSKYKTHVFLTSEALYAGMTRERTRIPKFVDIKKDEYDFEKTYDLVKRPIWFTPGFFLGNNNKILTKTHESTDINTFNVLDEGYPGTGGGKRRKSAPTYGTMETILPNKVLLTYGITSDKKVLERYQEKSTYIMGKKRTMFQIMNLSPIRQCKISHGGEIVPTQVTQDMITSFSEYNIYAITMRYMLIKGFYHEDVISCNFNTDDEEFCFPINLIPKEVLSS